MRLEAIPGGGLLKKPRLPSFTKRVWDITRKRIGRHTMNAHAHAERPDEGTDSSAVTPEGAPAADSTPETLSTEQRILDLESRLTSMSDAYLRAKAEAENIRRRAEEETTKVRKFAIEGFADGMLPVKDSLEAALALPNASNEQLLEGVRATLRQLSQALERNKVLAIDPPAGTRFDPHHHQAISVVPSEQESQTVVSVLQKGYQIADRVLRPALVTVSAPK
jgi:molecular chaperone GrpE